MSDRKVLFVVEGERGETRFLKKMHQTLLGTQAENIFVFGATIHRLFRKIFSGDSIDEDLDLTSVLMEDASESEREVLSQNFTPIFNSGDANRPIVDSSR